MLGAFGTSVAFLMKVKLVPDIAPFVSSSCCEHELDF